MKTIGFAGVYYTLWEVSEPYKVYVSKFDYYLKQDFMYIQNLSKDLDKAKSKIKGKYNIDFELKGEKSYTWVSEKLNDAPENVFAFGKYRGKEIGKIDDIEYIYWYYKETKNNVARYLLMQNGYVDYNNELYTEDAYKETKELERIGSLERGHLFNDNEKIEIEIKELESFSFEGQYGRVYVVVYESKCGKVLKYKGSSPKDIPKNIFQKVQATVKHGYYNEQKETRLQRINLR